ncbi:MAG TPA: YceI family protein [Gemmatimonadales bacterium]
MTAVGHNGKTRLMFGVVTALFLALSGRADAQLPIASGKVVAGTLSFDGSATVGDFTGTTTTLSGAMTGGPELSSVHGWVEAPVSTLRTGKDKRDQDMNKSMETEKYPTIRYELIGVTAGAWSGDTAQVTLRGRFLIHGVEKDVEFPGVVAVDQNAVRVRATVPLNLKDYRIGGLSRMLGVLKMHEDIVVHVDVTFASETASNQDLPLAESAAMGY